MVRVLKSVKSKEGRNIELLASEGALTDNPPLVIGVFHGDEPQGKFLIESYLSPLRTPFFRSNENLHNGVSRAPLLPEVQRSGETKSSILKGGNFQESLEVPPKGMLFIPCLNPDGLVRNTRTNANGVDLNRNFPTKNWGKNEGENATCDDKTTAYYGGTSPASEIETRFVVDIIEKYQPSKILTLHSPYKVVNYDGPAKELAEKISSIIGYPAEGSIGYPTPGSFGTYAGVERKILTITLELDETCPVEDLIAPVHCIFDELL